MARVATFTVSVTAFLFSGAAAAGETRVLDADYATVAFVKEDGRLLDPAYRTIGSLRGTSVVDAANAPAGRIDADGAIRDAADKIVAYLREEGKLVNASRETIGFMKINGTILDADYEPLGYVYNEDLTAPGGPALLAYLFFFARWSPSPEGEK